MSCLNYIWFATSQDASAEDEGEFDEEEEEDDGLAA